MEPTGCHFCDAPEYKHEIVRDGPEEFTVAEALLRLLRLPHLAQGRQLPLDQPDNGNFET